MVHFRSFQASIGVCTTTQTAAEGRVDAVLIVNTDRGRSEGIRGWRDSGKGDGMEGEEEGEKKEEGKKV